MMKIVIDLDGTLTVGEGDVDYIHQPPREEVIEALRKYRSEGYEVVIFTSRNMRTYKGSIGKINIHTLPAILEWLEKHSIPFDEVVVGKPWCGTDGYYVDDRAVRPDEFARLSSRELALLVEKGRKNLT